MCWMREGVKTDTAEPLSGLSCHVCMVAICCNIQFTCCWLRPYQPRQVDHHTDLNPIRIIKDFQLTGGRNDQLLVKSYTVHTLTLFTTKIQDVEQCAHSQCAFCFLSNKSDFFVFLVEVCCQLNTDSVNNAYLFISPYLSARLIIEATTRI